MKTQEQVWTSLVEANPVPDVDVFGSENMDDTTHLATLQQGSSEVTQLSTKHEETGQRSRSRTWLAAAALVIVIGIAAFVLNQSGEEAPTATDPVPTTIAEPTPTTTPEAMPTTAVDPAEAEWEAIPLAPSELAAGTQYRTSSAGFVVPLAYTVPEFEDTTDIGLTKIADFEEFVLLDCADESGHCGAIWLFDPGASTVDEAVDALISNSGPSFSEPTPTELGGAAGVELDITFDQPGSATLHGMSNGFDQIGIVEGEGAHAWFLEVEGQPVGILAIAPATGTFLDEAQTLIESIIWKELR